MPRKIARYGWLPDLPDHRDHVYTVPPAVAKTLPPRIDLRKLCPPVLDQSTLGSCTANAIANAHYFEQIKQGEIAPLLPSRLFLYYNQRAMAGTTDLDSGAMLRDAFKSIARHGVCSENRWPYEVAKFTKKPGVAAYKEALKQQTISYRRIPRKLRQLKGCLAEGRPFIFGFTAYQSLESPRNTRSGQIPLPSPVESPVGGHTVLAVGYDDNRHAFMFQNSWGERWGEHGFGYIPYAYLLDPGLAGDFWVMGLG
jgi:C1A family cysteine protease